MKQRPRDALPVTLVFWLSLTWILWAIWELKDYLSWSD